MPATHQNDIRKNTLFQPAKVTQLTPDQESSGWCWSAWLPPVHAPRQHQVRCSKVQNKSKAPKPLQPSSCPPLTHLRESVVWLMLACRAASTIAAIVVLVSPHVGAVWQAKLLMPAFLLLAGQSVHHRGTSAGARDANNKSGDNPAHARMAAQSPAKYRNSVFY
jgi:hypothetical protein